MFVLCSKIIVNLIKSWSSILTHYQIVKVVLYAPFVSPTPPYSELTTALVLAYRLAYRFGLPQGIWLGPWGHVDLKKPVDDPST